VSVEEKKTNLDSDLTKALCSYVDGSTVSPVAVERRTTRARAYVRHADRSTTVAWAAFAVLSLMLVGYLGSLIARGNGQSWTWLDGWSVCGVELVASTLCIVRSFVRRTDRTAALVLGLALLSWTIGDIALTIESLGGRTPSTPSVADAFYLGFYPLAYFGVILFMRGQVRRLTTPSWLDGAIAGLGAAAVCSAFAFHAIVHSTGQGALATATDLAYPIGDLLLLALVVGGTAILAGRRKAPWILMAIGIGLNVVGDTFNLFSSSSFGDSRLGTTFNAMAWPTAIVVIAMAVWLRPRPSNPLVPEKVGGFLLPDLAAASALVVLSVSSLHTVSRVAIGLAIATLFAVGIRLVLSVRRLQALSQERHRQSVTDDLTGLNNRRYLFRVLDTFFAECEESQTPARTLAFLFVDLNHFKEINDSFGHPAGDELLKQLGARLVSSLRNTDLLVRIGGDEFAVVLIDGDADYAAEVAERLTASLCEPFQLDVVSATISASIGIAMAPADATDSAALVWCADAAMYRAKQGSTSFQSYEQNLDDERDQMRLLDEMRAALDKHHLVLHYQPQLDLRSGEILAVEALIRWNHPRLGLLPPDKFLPLAEEAGLMREVTKWVLEEAAAQCAAWRASGRPLIVAVNISPTNLLEPGFVKMVKDQLALNDLPPDALVLEITETCAISEFETARRVIEELQSLGISVSIDDFGAGVTSLAYLSSLAVRELKLDRTFIQGLEGVDNERELDLVRSTIELGHAMGLRIVAEGIEDSETLDLLNQLGCDSAQGYVISRPKPASELAFRTKLGATNRQPPLAEVGGPS
jgi:diguanylate cyclase (GGDEF)-like protein